MYGVTLTMEHHFPSSLPNGNFGSARCVFKHLTLKNRIVPIVYHCKLQAVAIEAGVGGHIWKDVFPINSMPDESGPTSALQALVCSALQKALHYGEEHVPNRVDDHSIDASLSFTAKQTGGYNAPVLCTMQGIPRTATVCYRIGYEMSTSLIIYMVKDA